MDTILTLIPVLVAIFGVAVYSANTRIYCFILALSCIGAELPGPINITALMACVACLVAMGVIQVVKTSFLSNKVVALQN